MPNLRGGKAYKKSKGKSKLGEDGDVVFIDKQSDQMVGRIVRLLGNRNTSIYCEDKKVRVCKISSGCKKSARFEVGDIVLLSLRDCDISAADLERGVRSDRGDILDKYSPLQYAQLKKEGINPHVFATIDTVIGMAGKTASGDLAGAEALAVDAMEDIFDTGGDIPGGDTAGADEEDEEDGDKEAALATAAIAVRGQDKWKGVRAEVVRAKAIKDDDDDIDISAI
jgi:initiation factor 1A